MSLLYVFFLLISLYVSYFSDCFSISVCLSIASQSLYVFLYLCMSFYISVCISNISVCLSNLSCLSLYLSVCLYLCLSLLKNHFQYLSVCLSNLSVCLQISLSFCLSLCITLSVFRYLYDSSLRFLASSLSHLSLFFRSLLLCVKNFCENICPCIFLALPRALLRPPLSYFLFSFFLQMYLMF